MFHNVLMTTLTPIRDTNGTTCWDNKTFPTIWPDVKQEKSKDASIKKSIKKKKRNRTLFTTDQVRMLENIFAKSKYIDVERRREISQCLQIEQKCIKIWFQNRRMKEKKEISESCDSTSESQVSSLKSLSPCLESPQHSNNESDGYTSPMMHTAVRPSQYCYNTPNNFIKTEVHQDNLHSYEASHNAFIPEYLNYNNNNSITSNVWTNDTDYSRQYYPPQTQFQYYYNTGEINNQYTPTNLHDWPANMYDTSYF